MGNLDLCTYADSKSTMLHMFDALDVLKGRWRLPILLSLLYGDKRFSEISKDVSGISDKILAKDLKEMELNKLIKRTILDTFPPTVVYSITEHGKSVEKVLIELTNWGILHRKVIYGETDGSI